MYKYWLGLILFSSSSWLFAQGNYVFPPNPTPTAPAASQGLPTQVLPSQPSQALANSGYQPTTAYPYPAYPYAVYPNMGMQPYYPMQALTQSPQMPQAQTWPYPYAAYPNTMGRPPANLGMPAPNAVQTPAPSYAYTSPYNPNQPARPGPKPAPAPEVKKETKPWGDTRYIWPDFYTEQTSDAWDKMINAPHELGYMPGGWRFPSFSSPDPVTVGDAVANQVPPIVEEVPNFMNFTN